MTETAKLDGLIEGKRYDFGAGEANGSNFLTTGRDGDAEIVFHCEFAGFRNTVGAYLINDNGTIGEARIVFADATSSLADLRYPKVVDGSGPLDSGTTISLSSLFSPETLKPEHKFGLFLVQDGASQNDLELFEGNPELAFVNKRTGRPVDHDTKAAQVELVIRGEDGDQGVDGRVIHSHGGDGDKNPINQGNKVHAISQPGDQEDATLLSFEDLHDRDFNDVILEVLVDGAEPTDFGKTPEDDPAQKIIRLDELDGVMGTVIHSSVSDRAGTIVDGLGDFNGDGIDDLILGGDQSDLGGMEDRGVVYIAFGQDGGLGTSFDLSGMDGSNGFAVRGNTAGDQLGWSGAGVGDVNGDGFADALFGGQHIEGVTGDTGGAYLLFGGAGLFSTGQTADELVTAGRALFFRGLDFEDEAAITVDGAGDVNDDGFADLLIGARLADPMDALYSAGETYLIFGGNNIETDLSALDGNTGMTFWGTDWFDQSGRGLAGIGDINNDGIDDFAIGAPDADPNGLLQGGESYVVFGNSGGFSATLEAADLDGSNGFVIENDEEFDFSSFDIDGAGDVNGDGIDDMIIGSFSGTAPDSPVDAGEAFVLFGDDDPFDALVNLGDLDGENGFRIAGIDAGDMAGRSVSAAGDFNGDGLGDILIGAHLGQDEGVGIEGEAYLIFGSNDGFDSTFEIATMTDDQGCIFLGVRGGGVLGFDVGAAGDVNNDGFDDLIIGEPGETALDQEGRAFLLYGSGAPGVVNVASLFDAEAASSDQTAITGGFV